MYMWNQNNDINEGIYKTETDNVENRHSYTGERQGRDKLGWD